MAVNRGKQFEDVVEAAFEKVPNTSIVRLHDQTTGYIGSTNHCDFIVYREPLEYHIECKSVHGNTLSIHSNPKPDKRGVLHGFYGNITDTQWTGLLEKSKVPGVIAGVLCWWVDKDVTKFIPIQFLDHLREWTDIKSIRYDTEYSMRKYPKFDKGVIRILEYDEYNPLIEIPGTKKRVFFDYDMEAFLDEISVRYGRPKRD